MRRQRQYAGLLALLVLSACGGDAAPPQLPPVATLPTPQEAPVVEIPAVPAVDAGMALVEARRCGRAIAVAARCNYLRDDRDVATLRFTVLQGLGQRYGDVVDQQRLTEAVDLAVLDRLSTIGQCAVAPSDVPVVQEGLRDVLGACAAP